MLVCASGTVGGGGGCFVRFLGDDGCPTDGSATMMIFFHDKDQSINVGANIVRAGSSFLSIAFFELCPHPRSSPHTLE